MNINEKNLILLHYCSLGNYRTIEKFYQYDPTFSSIQELSSRDMVEKIGMRKNSAVKLVHLLKNIKTDDILLDLQKKSISYTTFFRENYPPYLKTIYDPPWVLYYTGNPILLTKIPSISVVGTRHPSEYALRELTQIISSELCEKLMIVSGLALGIDGMAHQLAMKRKGNTIAVLGYGLDHIYPKTHTELFQQMQKHQLLISEYPSYVKPQRWHFPERNRIISGISQATFVVEAQERSGSLITSELALQQGRDVFALPGRISEPTSKGTNQLIQEGAKMILSSHDILEEYI